MKPFLLKVILNEKYVICLSGNISDRMYKKSTFISDTCKHTYINLILINRTCNSFTLKYGVYKLATIAENSE